MSPTLHGKVVEMSRGARGGFAAKLADAWLHADKSNQRSIEAAFPELFWPEPTYEELRKFVGHLSAIGPVCDSNAQQVLGAWVKGAQAFFGPTKP